MVDIKWNLLRARNHLEDVKPELQDRLLQAFAFLCYLSWSWCLVNSSLFRLVFLWNRFALDVLASASLSRTVFYSLWNVSTFYTSLPNSSSTLRLSGNSNKLTFYLVFAPSGATNAHGDDHFRSCCFDFDVCANCSDFDFGSDFYRLGASLNSTVYLYAIDEKAFQRKTDSLGIVQNRLCKVFFCHSNCIYKETTSLVVCTGSGVLWRGANKNNNKSEQISNRLGVSINA